MANKPYIETGDDTTNIYLECTETGSILTGTANLTAPAFEELKEIRFYGSKIKITDPAYSIDRDMADFGSVNWLWMGYTCAPEVAYSGSFGQH